MSRRDETHISVTVDTKDKLKLIAKKEKRTMRTVIARLIDEAYKKAGT